MPNNVHGIFLVGAGLGLPNRGLLLKQGAASSLSACEHAQAGAPTSRTLQWQKQPLVELVDDGGDLGGLWVVSDCEFNT